jgi:hypothetical protein
MKKLKALFLKKVLKKIKKRKFQTKIKMFAVKIKTKS